MKIISFTNCGSLNMPKFFMLLCFGLMLWLFKNGSVELAFNGIKIILFKE